jgi:hypothetical protein
MQMFNKDNLILYMPLIDFVFWCNSSRQTYLYCLQD